MPLGYKASLSEGGCSYKNNLLSIPSACIAKILHVLCSDIGTLATTGRLLTGFPQWVGSPPSGVVSSRRPPHALPSLPYFDVARSLPGVISEFSAGPQIVQATLHIIDFSPR